MSNMSEIADWLKGLTNRPTQRNTSGGYTTTPVKTIIPKEVPISTDPGGLINSDRPGIIPNAPGQYDVGQWPYMRDYNGFPNTGYIDGNHPGENNLSKAAMLPLNWMNDTLVSRLGTTSPNLTGTMQGIFDSNIGSQLQQIMGITPEQQASQVASYDQLLSPTRQAQMGGLSSQLAAMGLGGGRAARAAAGLTRDFNTDTSKYALGLKDNEANVRNQIGQIMSGMGNTQFGADSSLMNNILALLGQNTQQMSNVPLSSFAAYKP